jgi:predicted PurR-regulated permease PerM
VRIFGRDLGFKDLALQVQSLSSDISSGQVLTLIKNTLFGQVGFFATTSILVNGIFNTFLTFVLAIYLALEEKGVQKFLRIFAPLTTENYIEDLWGRAQKKISLWIQGQFLLSFLVSLLVYIPMLILSMPYSALLAILAFIGELIPVVGLTLATIPALLLAWVHGGVSLLTIVAGIYFIIGQLEGHVLYPKIMHRAVGVPSVLIIISMLIGGHLAGFWGIVLAVPMSSIFMELVLDYDKRKHPSAVVPSHE